MCKFYRYLAYRFYAFCLKRKDMAPVMSTGILFYILHLFQFIGLTCIFPFLSLPAWDIGTLYIFVIAVLIVHLIIFNKRRLEKYLEEFKDEDSKHKKIGTWGIIAYYVGTYVIVGILFINC